MFRTDRNFKESGSYVDKRKRVGAIGDSLHIFLQDSEDWMPSNMVEEIEEFCQNARLKELNLDVHTEQRRAAWLDDRSFQHRESSGCARRYGNALTATALYELLKKPRYNDEHELDADRRLIYIADLDPHYILALAETVSSEHHPALRDTILNHFSLQSLIKVKITTRGYLTFQLEFHLPYFAFRKCPLTAEAFSQKPAPSKQLPRRWTDLPFLNTQTANSEHQIKYRMYEAQTSLVVCGSHEQQWTAYAFVDRYFNTEDPLDQEFSYEGIQDDPITWNSELDTVYLDGNKPTWNPRVYFLVVLEAQITQVLKEWAYVVRQVERNIKQYHNQYSSSNKCESGRSSGVQNAKEGLDWTLQITGVLNQLLDVLSNSMKCWEGFISNKGDHGYFSDSSSFPESDKSRSDAYKSLRAINNLFETLESHQRTLIALEKICDKMAQDLHLGLTRQINEAVRYNGVTGELTLSVISPFMLASAVFTMSQQVIPIKQNFKSVVVTVFINMAMINLLFVFLGDLSRHPRWWKKFAPWIKALQLDRAMPTSISLLSECYGNLRTPRRGSTTSSETTDRIEMSAGV